MAHIIKGYYHDLLYDQKGVKQDNGRRSNLIVEGCNRLLAALMKGQLGVAGICYLAIGQGLKLWDAAPPKPIPGATRLFREILRRPIATEEIIFLDSSNQPVGTPTGRLQISLQFSRDDFAANGFQSVREFGLFGGNATLEADSGFMINHVIHPRIDITGELTLHRTLCLDFSQCPAVAEEFPGFGASLPARSIDGVGSAYVKTMNAAGVNVLADLLTLNPLVPLAGIPAVKIREFRAKARMVMAIKTGLTPFAALFHLSISELLRKNPETLAGMANSFTVNTEMAANLQEELMPLQVALDDQQLKKITLGSLVNQT